MFQFVPAAKFFRFAGSDETPKTRQRRTDRDEWRRGKRLVGITDPGTLLTDGTDDPSFMGHEWVETWDDRPEFTVYPTWALSRLVYLSAAPRLIFIGKPTVVKDYVAPEQVAIESAAIHPASRHVSGDDLRVSTDEAMLNVLEAGGSIEVCLNHGFKPLHPLSRAQWKTLGYHIHTGESKTIDAVLPMVSYASRFLLPLPTYAKCEEHGISPVLIGAIVFHDGVCLNAQSMRITDPVKAAAVFPFFGRLSAGQSLVTREWSYIPDGKGWAWIEFTDAERLVKIPEGELLTEHSGTPSVRMKISDIEALPGEFIRAKCDNVSSAFVSAADADTLFISARKAAGRYQIPVTVYSLQLFVDGKPLPGQYYLRSQITLLDKSATTRSVNRKRHAQLSKKYGTELPPNWKDLSDSQVEDVVVWQRRKADGWLTQEELNTSLNLPAQELSWLKEIEQPSANAVGKEPLYQPISFEELVVHPQFLAALRKTFPNHLQFLLKVMFDDKAKANLLAGMLAA